MKAKWMTAAMIAAFSGALAVGTAASAGGMGSSHSGEQGTSFNKLDADQDGRISQQEAAANPALAERFKRLDQNGNEQLDQGEFAQFETMQREKRKTKVDEHKGMEHW
ncbi:EF-hand domain-containing protein [Nitrococcus mobilis]|uniref:Uncharacterized protein n=1 Tax=Nitrococcus mobilis Nb-231 TaxID=314278 RepID=A4BM61_9GAMM|nr:hypothetical protein [Nitrococcus mobilis]EAR23399.1 hypothetical protein NB231_16303 [Nitrococcus mobilis Nb-231]